MHIVPVLISAAESRRLSEVLVALHQSYAKTALDAVTAAGPLTRRAAQDPESVGGVNPGRALFGTVAGLVCGARISLTARSRDFINVRREG